MKTNKLHIFSLLTLSAFIGLAPIVRADDTPATPPPAAGGGTNGPAGRANMRAAMDKFLTSINATEDQKEQLKTIFKDRNEKLKAMRDDTSLSKEDKKAKRTEIADATNTKVKGVLTADQYTQYEAFIKLQGNGRHNQQPPAN
jgi:periplasmic protein CpxP/Spy